MIKSIIIEDEINVRQGLKKMLNFINTDIEIIAETGFVKEGIDLINQHQPDLVFMDIELEDGKSFDILKQLKKIDFKIIFTTAYNQYAIKAFKFSAIDYLLKPIDPLELKDALERAISNIENEKEHHELLEVLKNNIENKEQKIVLKTAEQRYVLNVNDIIRLEADGAYTLFKTINKNIIVSKNLKYYQNILDEKLFVRCHQSHLISVKHIVGIEKNTLIMSNKDIINISTRKKALIKTIVNKL